VPTTMACAHFDGGARAPKPSMKDLLVGSFSEFMAMLLFVFFGCGSASSNAQFQASGEWVSASVLMISLQFGLAIVALAYATAHTSGAHINCAVTLALAIVGTCHPLRAVAYLVSQCLGSIAGALLLKAATAGSGALDRTGGLGANGLQNAHVGLGNAFVAEVMGTYLLVYVVLETAVNTKAVTADDGTMIRGQKQTLAPLAIGLAVFLAHVVLVPITGCSINPTRSFGPSVVANSWDHHWLWWVGPCTGAVLAAFTWLLLKTVEKMPDGGSKVAPPPPPRGGAQTKVEETKVIEIGSS